MRNLQDKWLERWPMVTIANTLENVDVTRETDFGSLAKI